MYLLLIEANEIHFATIKLGMVLAGRFETRLEEGIVLTGYIPTGIAGKVGIVQRFSSVLSELPQ